MPPPLIKSFAAKSGKSANEVEALYKEVKASAQKKKPPPRELYAYIVGTLKKILKIESLEIDPVDFLIELVLLGEDEREVLESVLTLDKNSFELEGV